MVSGGVQIKGARPPIPVMPRIEVSVGAGTTLMVEGRAEAEILGGRVEVFGLEAGPGFKARIDLYKAAPFHVLEDARIAVEGGKAWAVEGDTIPGSWRELAERVVSEKPRKIMVVGPVDVGKSGLVTFLVNRLAASGLRAAVVDADTGQSDIGPPTTIGLGIAERPVVMLGEIPLYDAFFVGLTSPSGLIHRSVAGVTVMAERGLSLGADTVIVDTTGWVYDPGGRDLKISKAVSLRPDLIVAVDRGGALAHLTRFLSRLFDVVAVEPAVRLRPRSREERREIRRTTYGRYLAGARDVEIGFEDIASGYSFAFSGEPLPREELEAIAGILGVEVYYGEASGDSIVIFVGAPVPQAGLDLLASLYEKKYVKAFTGPELAHTLVAFGDREKMFRGLGVIKHVDPRRRVVTVYTPVEPREGMYMQLGYIKVNPATLEEEGWIEKWSI